jgi:uncharacterized protein YeaO (DUF488 family)
MPVRLKRIYEPAARGDGYRILVDRLWPRGVSKDAAEIDHWLKGVAPSPDLRKWFGHRPDRFDEFATRYRTELDSNASVDELRSLIDAHRTVTLLYGAKDESCNHAVVLAGFLARS